MWRSDYYRFIYAAAMVHEAPMYEHPDVYFISNSAIYTPALDGVLRLNDGEDVEDFVIKLLQSISRLNRIPRTEYLVELGRGMDEEEELRNMTSLPCWSRSYWEITTSNCYVLPQSSQNRPWLSVL